MAKPLQKPNFLHFFEEVRESKGELKGGEAPIITRESKRGEAPLKTKLSPLILRREILQEESKSGEASLTQPSPSLF